MKQLKERFFLGINTTPREEYRKLIGELQVECASLREANEATIKARTEWAEKYGDVKSAYEALLKGRDALNNKIDTYRSKNAEYCEEVRNLNAFIEKLKKETSATQDKLEKAEALAQRLALSLQSAETDAKRQEKAYIELAHDYDLLKEEYDSLRVAIAMTQTENKPQPEEYTVEAPSSPGELFEDIEVVAGEAPMAPEEVIVGESVLVEDADIDDESVIDLADEEPLPSSPDYAPKKKKSKKKNKK